MYSLLLCFLGRADELIAEIKTAIDLEPAAVLNHHLYGQNLFYARRYDEAIAELERTVEMDPKFFFAYNWLSGSYLMKGNDDRAFDAFLKQRTLAGEQPDEINSWKMVYAKSGWRGISKRQFADAKEEEKNGKPNYNYLANQAIEAGQPEEALAYLEKALAQRRWQMVTLKVNPRSGSPGARTPDLKRSLSV